MPKPIYMLVTNDKYQLPLDFAESGSELARKIGVKVATLYCGITRNTTLRVNGEKLRVVKVCV